MTLPVRKLVLTYAGVSFGAGTNFVLDAYSQPMRYKLTYDHFSFGCDIVVSETTEDLFKTACGVVEATFAMGNNGQAFSLDMGARNIESFDPGPNTGFNHAPTCVKPGSPKDSALSRLYQVTMDIDLPYKETGKAGRRETEWAIEFTDARRRKLMVAATYTALASNQAYKQYLASIGAIATAIQASIGGTWEGPLNERVNGDLYYNPSGTGDNQLGKILTFSREYQELIYNNAVGVLADVRLRRHELKVTHETTGPGDYAPGGVGVFRLHPFKVEYSVAVDYTKTQDLVSIYTGTIKPFMIDEARKAVGGGALALTFHAPRYDRVENLISASAAGLAAVGGPYLNSRVVTVDQEDPGVELVGVWNGQKLARKPFENPGHLVRTVTWEYEVLGKKTGDKGAGGGAAAGGGGAFGIFGAVPVNFQIVESSAQEAAIDNFFGIAVQGPGGRKAKAGGGGLNADAAVPEPKDLTAVFIGGVTSIEPVVYGIPGERQFTTTKFVIRKSWEYIRPPGPNGSPVGDDKRTATHAFGDPNR